MPTVDDQVIDFYYSLFDSIFSQSFGPKIKDRLKRDTVVRQVQEAAGAGSQALIRFFESEQLSEAQTALILSGYARLRGLLKVESVANPNRTPEALVEELLAKMPCPVKARTEAIATARASSSSAARRSWPSPTSPSRSISPPAPSSKPRKPSGPKSQRRKKS